MDTTIATAADFRQSPSTRRASYVRRWVVHLFRMALLIAICWLIRSEHVSQEIERAIRNEDPVTIEMLSPFLPDAASLGEGSRMGARRVLDASGDTVGYFVQTSPQADTIVGYSGPTNTLLVFDSELRTLGMELVRSADTAEHVRDVKRDDEFMTALVGKRWEEVADASDVDAVSGATLTSLAVLEGIRLRLGGAQPSLRFPDEIALTEVQALFPSAVKLTPRASFPAIHDVYDEQGNRLGAVARTSPAADDEMGYQGPTDTLLALAREDRVLGIRIRNSYDNEPYVGYVRDDSYFAGLFNGQSLAELSKFDPELARVEGVSGATMTSRAIAYGLPKGARLALIENRSERSIIWSARDVGTCVVLAFAVLISFTRMRGHRWLRLSFQLLLVIYFGFLNGDMISQALLVGWAQSGVPWHLAPGLTLLTAAALLVPATSKKQLYCHHVCPFGAAQQLVRNRLPWKVRLQRGVTRTLSVFPALLLLLVVLVAMLHWPLNLASIEPFDAFIFWIAGVGTISVAFIGMIASLFVPMAYCRFGCPTGAMLSYLRYNAHSDRWSTKDAVALGLLLVAFAIRVS